MMMRCCVAFVLTGLVVVLGGPLAGADDRSDVPPADIRDSEIDRTLGFGADAYWAGSGRATLAAGLPSPIGTIVVRGCDDRPISVLVEALLTAGSSSSLVVQAAVSVPATRTVEMPLDLYAIAASAGFAAHSTCLLASVVLVDEQGTEQRRVQLEPRFLLAGPETGAREVLDEPTYEAAVLRRTPRPSHESEDGVWLGDQDTSPEATQLTAPTAQER